jgi:hypothetical protein
MLIQSRYRLTLSNRAIESRYRIALSNRAIESRYRTRLSTQVLNYHGNALSATDTQRGYTITLSAMAQFVGQREEQSGPACAYGVAECNGTAVDVCAVPRQLKFSFNTQVL